MTATKPKVEGGFRVTVFGTDLDLSEAEEVIARISRPDGSVVERPGVPVEPQRLELALHTDDLTLNGEYVGEVELVLAGEPLRFSPAFMLLSVSAEANA